MGRRQGRAFHNGLAARTGQGCSFLPIERKKHALPYPTIANLPDRKSTGLVPYRRCALRNSAGGSNLGTRTNARYVALKPHHLHLPGPGRNRWGHVRRVMGLLRKPAVRAKGEPHEIEERTVRKSRLLTQLMCTSSQISKDFSLPISM